MTDPSNYNDRNVNGEEKQVAEIIYEVSDDELPSEAVVRATATLTNTPVIDLDPLYSVIDPDHLDGLFGDFDGRDTPEERSVAFTFNECHVSVTGATVTVRIPTETTS